MFPEQISPNLNQSKDQKTKELDKLIGDLEINED